MRNNNATNVNNKGKAALYCRVASASPDDSDVVEHQQGYLRDFAIQQGFDDFVEYLDNGYSGNNLDRPAFVKMDADIKEGRFEVVIVRNIGRVARNCILAENWIRGLDAHGVKFISADGMHERSSFILGIYRELAQNSRHRINK